MRVRTIGYSLLICTLALAGCGGESDDSSNGGSGGSGGTGGSGSEIPFEDVLDKIIELQCDAINTCASDVISLYLPGMDCATYFGRGFEDGDWPSIKKAVEDGRVIYHGDKAQACIETWSGLECDIFTSRAPEICEETLEGTVAEGGACTLDAECKGPLFCKVAGSCPGVCSVRRSEGAACNADDECVNGLTCDDTLKTCVAPGEAGDSCDAGEPECVLGLPCVGGDDKTPGTCKEISEVFVGNDGDSCDFEGGWCKPGLSCVLEAWTEGPVASCKPLAASGANCGPGIPNQCPVGEYCDADPATTGVFEGTCTPLPAAGDPCVGIVGTPRCKSYHVCDANDVCQEIQRLDGDCGGDEECYSGNCEDGKCKPTNACTK